MTEKMISAAVALLIGAVVLVIGILADELYSRFGVPDVLIMIFLGAFFGPILGLIPKQPLMSVAPYLAGLTLAIVLFESGINFPAQRGFSEAARAVIYAFLGVILSMSIAIPFFLTIYSWNPLEGALVGAIVGGSSSAIVLSLMPKMNISEGAKKILSLESIFTDSIVIVIAMLIIRLLTIPSSTITIEMISREIMGAIIISILTGFSSALALSKIIANLQKKTYGDIFLLGVVILIYGVAEQIGGSGALTIFVFAITLANIRSLIPWVRLMESPSLIKRIKKGIPSFRYYSRKFYAQIAFLMRTYFFAFLGMIFSTPSFQAFLIGLGFTACLIFVRYLSTYIITMRSNFSRRDRFFMTLTCGRGLAAAILASLLLTYGIGASILIQELTTQIIIYTSILSAIATYLSKTTHLFLPKGEGIT